MATQQDTIIEGVRVKERELAERNNELWLKAKAKEALSRLPLKLLPRKSLQCPLLAGPEFACRLNSFFSRTLPDLVADL